MNRISKKAKAHNLFYKASDLEDAGNFNRAAALYTRSAKLGLDISQNNLAVLLDNGHIPKRRSEAVYWYRRAIRSGLAQAAWNLALHYRELKMKRWYMHWLYVAAQMGDPDAVQELRIQKRRDAEGT